MASIKKIDTRKYKITVSNGYRPDGRKISRAKTITVPDNVHSRSIHQYVAHEAEEFERLIGQILEGELPDLTVSGRQRAVERDIFHQAGKLFHLYQRAAAL